MKVRWLDEKRTRGIVVRRKWPFFWRKVCAEVVLKPGIYPSSPSEFVYAIDGKEVDRDLEDWLSMKRRWQPGDIQETPTAPQLPEAIVVKKKPT